jgi:hypothetical protein
MVIIALVHTQTDITLGGTPLGEESARHRDLLPDNTQQLKRKIAMPPAAV